MFNYQLVFKFKNDERIIFAGVTTKDPQSLIDDCIEQLVDDSNLTIENFSFIPKEFCDNGKKEKTP